MPPRGLTFSSQRWPPRWRTIAKMQMPYVPRVYNDSRVPFPGMGRT
jgi:hypothetical protein